MFLRKDFSRTATLLLFKINKTADDKREKHYRKLSDLMTLAEKQGKLGQVLLAAEEFAARITRGEHTTMNCPGFVKLVLLQAMQDDLAKKYPKLEELFGKNTRARIEGLYRCHTMFMLNRLLYDIQQSRLG